MKKKYNATHFPSGKWRKLLMLMKLKLVLLLCCAGNLTAGSLFSQQVTLDVSFQNQTLEVVLNELKARTGYSFTYNKGAVDEGAKVSVELRDATLDQILDKVLKERGYNYEVDDKVVFISAIPGYGAQANARRNAQPTPATVTGRVRDADGRPVIGASVVLKSNPSIGTATDAAGHFSLRIPDRDNAVLMVSFLGKKSVQIGYNGQPEIIITLEDDAAEIEDIVVTGIFNRPRESYTGSVSTITAKELETFRGQNLIQTLGNIDPAINIMENNLAGSNPNVLPEISIRGSSSLPVDVQAINQGEKYSLNTPLIIMDGFEISLQKLMDYNDEEILSINILKDASATAIYGSRGANGVIVITSKQPVPGRLRINARVGIDIEMPDLSSYDLLNAAEKLQLEWDNKFYGNIENPTADRKLKETYNARLRDVLEGTDTYWLAKPLRTGISQKYNLRLEGGSEEFRWGVSTAYNHIAGVMKNSYRDNFSGQIMLQYQYRNISFRNQTEIVVNKGVESNYGSFSDYAAMNPYHKIYDEEGALIKEYETFPGTTKGNPLYDASLQSKNQSAYTEIINNLSVEWTITKGLILRGTLGISHKNSSTDIFVSPLHSSFLTDSYYTTGDGVLERGRYTYQPGQNNTYDGNINLGYSRVFNDKHQLYAGLDYSILQRKSFEYTIIGEGYNNEKLGSLGNAMQYPNGRPAEDETLVRSIGLTGNVNYTYDNRYYADLSFRVDGSSQFGSKQRFAPFWSAGLGWNVHNEKFLRDNSVIDNLRLKVSYGQSGSQQFSAYQALSTFGNYIGDRYGNWGGAYLKGFGNEDLKWQVTDQVNIGTEIGILRNRLTFSFDYYIKKTSNLLSSIDVPLATGFKSYSDNIGEVKNTGFEASLGGFLIRDTERDIMWNVNAKIAYNKNRITKLSEDIKRQTKNYLDQDVDTSTLFYEGDSQNSLYVVRSLGIDPSTGNEIFLNRYGMVVDTWKPSDKVWAGENSPSYRGNLSTMFRYKNLSVNLSFAYHWGGVIYNSTLISRVEGTRSSIGSNNVDRRVLTDRWSAPGDYAKYKKIPGPQDTEIRTRGTTRFVMPDRVFQLQTASVEYRLATKWLEKAGISSARIGVNLSDLFYISSVKRERGTDYPFARRCGASVTLIF